MAESASRPHRQRELLYWIATVAKDRREGAQIKKTRIADRADLDPTSVWYFEKAKRWPKKIDRLVAVYADETGLGDGRLLWQEAVNRWLEHGRQPLAQLDGEADELETAVQESEALGRKIDSSSKQPAKGSSARGSGGRKRNQRSA